MVVLILQLQCSFPQHGNHGTVVGQDANPSRDCIQQDIGNILSFHQNFFRCENFQFH